MKNKMLFSLSLIVSLVFLMWLLINLPNWTSFPEWTGLRDKKAWDLFEVLIVPVVLAGGAIVFSESQRNAEIQIETERQRESAFQAYIDRIKDLVVDLQTSEVDVETLGNIGAAYTRATLQQLDVNRKRMLLEFLYDSQLIGWSNRVVEEKHLQLISLGESADFSGLVVDFRASSGIRLALCGANLAHVNFSNSKLAGLDLHQAYLSSCNMSNSSFTFVDFSDADMSGINLSNTRMGENVLLDRAELRFANLKNADLRKVNLDKVNSIFSARYNHKTKFPPEFNPTKKEMIFER